MVEDTSRAGFVALADDHNLFRQGLRQLLEGAGYEVAGEAGSGEEALDLAASLPEGCVVLMDISMPGLDGLQALRRLVRTRRDLPVIILSARDDSDALFSAMSAGARGYVAKEASTEELFSAIETVRSGGIAMSAAAAANLAPGLRELDYAPGTYEKKRLELSDREHEVLRLLATPQSPAQIAASLFLSPKTVQNHTSAIYRKLGVRSRSEAVIKAIELHLLPGSGG